MLNVSRMTIYRRRRQFGMLQNTFQDIGYTELMSNLRRIRNNYPAMGDRSDGPWSATFFGFQSYPG